MDCEAAAVKRGRPRKYASEDEARQHKNAALRAKRQALAAAKTTTSMSPKERRASLQRARRHADEGLRQREAKAKRRKRQQDKALRQQEAEAKRRKRKEQAEARVKVAHQAAANCFSKASVQNPCGSSLHQTDYDAFAFPHDLSEQVAEVPPLSNPVAVASPTAITVKPEPPSTPPLQFPLDSTPPQSPLKTTSLPLASNSKPPPQSTLKTLVDNLALRCHWEDAIREELRCVEQGMASARAALEELQSKKQELQQRHSLPRKGIGLPGVVFGLYLPNDSFDEPMVFSPHPSSCGAPDQGDSQTETEPHNVQHTNPLK
ncbi:uncharacterized protein [Dermacentor andersoni]|uniref:uncharacterized protein isoform X2 n=1 Tax=Dermacentor andersoni TaxID=34620 RepID=UPI002417600C|nr:protein enabled homolog isoform X2 [Dermacentor andersoni]